MNSIAHLSTQDLLRAYDFFLKGDSHNAPMRFSIMSGNLISFSRTNLEPFTTLSKVLQLFWLESMKIPFSLFLPQLKHLIMFAQKSTKGSSVS